MGDETLSCYRYAATFKVTMLAAVSGSYPPCNWWFVEMCSWLMRDLCKLLFLRKIWWGETSTFLCYRVGEAAPRVLSIFDLTLRYLFRRGGSFCRENKSFCGVMIEATSMLEML